MQNGDSARLNIDQKVLWNTKGVNQISVAVAIAMDLKHQPPTNQALNTTAQICAEYMHKYNLGGQNIIGHKEAKQYVPQHLQKELTNTDCPGYTFLEGGKPWKDKLINKSLEYSKKFHDKFS